MVDVVLRTEYGGSSSPKIRFIKLLFPEPVSPVKIASYQYIRWDWSHLEGLQETIIELGSSLKGGRKWILVACVANVSVRFRSKEQGTRVKERAKNGASKRAGRGWGYCVKIGVWSGRLLAKFKISLLFNFFVRSFIKTYYISGP